MAAIRIANAQGFWGDRPDVAARLVALEPDLDYITLDYLAEVSLSIMAIQRDKDPKAGYARDFIEVIRSLAPAWQAGRRVKVVTNAGGLNPQGCVDACAIALNECGIRGKRIALVTGDDVLPHLRDRVRQEKGEFSNLETGEPLSKIADRLATANAYVGGAPIAQALAAGADIVVTGRVADPSLAVGPCLHELRWKESNWDAIAGATVAGHLIECGTQATGGIACDWLELADNVDIGFPIVEVEADGACTLTKPRGSGGSATERTVKEQLLYELGDPDNYKSPDATVSFLGLRVEQVGVDRVRVAGARGSPPPPTYKVSATYREGYMCQAMVVIFGARAVANARRAGEVVLERVRRAGFLLERTQVDCLGAGECARGVVANPNADNALECVLRMAVFARDRRGPERFAREIAPLVTGGPQGLTGYATGRPDVRPVFGYWPCLIDRNLVMTQVKWATVPR